MKYLKTMLACATALLAAAAMSSMAMAQDSLFGERLNRFLNEHPNLAEKVRADPQLLYSRQFREEHPELRTFMQEHPEVYTKLNERVPRPGERGFGAYDRNHQWRDANWWHQNDPAWVNKNHPEWAGSHPDWNRAGAAEVHPGAVAAEGHHGTEGPGSQAAPSGQEQKHGHHAGNTNHH